MYRHRDSWVVGPVGRTAVDAGWVGEVVEETNVSMKDQAIEVGKIDGYEYWILESPLLKNGLGGLNGYVVFPDKPVKEPGYDGILIYVPVHGGITFCHHGEDGSVYGFDTAHCHSENYPRMDKKWIKSECGIMLKGILLAAEKEDEYLLA